MAQLSYRRHRFPASIIQHAIWRTCASRLSHRDVEDLLAERGLDISYETVRRWVLKFERQQAEVRFARDSPLEGDGFEPSVPQLQRPTGPRLEERTDDQCSVDLHGAMPP